MAETLLPTDNFSIMLRGLQDNPGALAAESTIHTRDFYGNTESWIVRTFRADGEEFVLLQRNGAADSLRLVLTPEVTKAIATQRDRIIARIRRRGARQAVETKRAKGKPVGNPEALRKARRGKQ